VLLFEFCDRVTLTMIIARVEESKRGNWFGPVVAIASIPYDENSRELVRLLKGRKGQLRDSKKLSKSTRQKLLPQIQSSIIWRIGYATTFEIELDGIYFAWCMACVRAVKKLPVKPDRLIIDGSQTIPYLTIPQTTLVDGDRRDFCLAASSVIVKEWSDALVERLGKRYPHQLAKHHGYGTELHRQELAQHGLTPQHRASFCKHYA
jgi:ribonuclease HII